LNNSFKLFSFIFFLSFIFFSCQKGSTCDNCEDIIDGYTMIKVSQNDLIKYEGLATINGISVGTCIQGIIFQEEITLTSIKILDECCCEL
tara:strand:+ start:883 stop:1152 length:270 start_codon:yes stop_codon:yes gene_type:complete